MLWFFYNEALCPKVLFSLIFFIGISHKHTHTPVLLCPELTRVNIPNRISIGSAVFAGLTSVTNTQIDRQTGLATSNHL